MEYRIVMTGPHGERDYLEKLLDGGIPCVGGGDKDYAGVFGKECAENIAAGIRKHWLNPHVGVELEAVIDAESTMAAIDEAPDFDSLRAERNRRVMEHHQELADELGVPLSSLCSNFNPNACYCACSSGGPCEHKWNGEGVEFDEGRGWSATCSRCGCTAMSHDMRVLP